MIKKGFTLVEMMIVIAILGLISLIVFPNVTSMLKKIDSDKYQRFLNDIFLASEAYIQANIKDYPDLKIKNRKIYVYFNELMDAGYLKTSVYDNKNAKSVKDEDFTVELYLNDDNEYTYKLYEEHYYIGAKIEPSEFNLTFPNTATFEIVSNYSGGLVSCEMEDSQIASCSILGKNGTIVLGEKNGNTNMIIRTAATSKYGESILKIPVTNNPGSLKATISGYKGVYDGSAHRISVQCDGATIKYGLSEGEYNLDDCPLLTDVGTKTVYYKIKKVGYADIIDKADIVISKAPGTLTAPTAKSLQANGTNQQLINAGSSTTGTIQYKLNNGIYSTNIPTAKDAGTYTVYYKLVGDKNHTDVAEKSLTVTMKPADYIMTHTCNSYPSQCDFSTYPLNHSVLSSGAYLNNPSEVYCVCWYGKSSAQSLDYQVIKACPNGGSATKVSGGKPNGPNSNRTITVKCSF